MLKFGATLLFLNVHTISCRATLPLFSVHEIHLLGRVDNAIQSTYWNYH